MSTKIIKVGDEEIILSNNNEYTRFLADEGVKFLRDGSSRRVGGFDSLMHKGVYTLGPSLQKTPPRQDHKEDIPAAAAAVTNDNKRASAENDDLLSEMNKLKIWTKGEVSKMEGEFSKMEGEVSKIKMDQTHKGVTSNAQFYDDLVKQQALTATTEDAVWKRTEEELWFDKELTTVGGTSEKHVQETFERILTTLADEFRIKNNARSLPWPGAYNRVSFGTRKPDIVNYEKGTTGALGITSFGELKKVGSNDFSADEKGQILDMARKFMELNPLRPFVIVFLSDGTRWQFFRVARPTNREHNRLVYTHSAVSDDSKAGWLRYLSLLSSEIQNLGHFLPVVEGFRLKEALGKGMSCVVYKGQKQQKASDVTAPDEDVVVKFYWDRCKFENEQLALQMLAGVKGTPDIVCTAAVNNQPPDPLPSLHNFALVVTPVGMPIAAAKAAHAGQGTVDGRHLQQLVKITKQAHSLGLIHRDLKPDNIYFSNSDQANILLNDWASCIIDSGRVSDGDSQTTQLALAVEGTHGYSVMPGENGYKTWKTDQARDLVALVRTSYTLLFHESPGSREGVLVEQFWERRFRGGTVWHKALKDAGEEAYDALSNALGWIK